MTASTGPFSIHENLEEPLDLSMSRMDLHKDISLVGSVDVMEDVGRVGSGRLAFLNPVNISRDGFFHM